MSGEDGSEVLGADFCKHALTALLFLVVLVPLLGFMGKWLTPDEINLYYGFVSAPVFSVYSSITTYYFVTAED